MPGVIRAVHHSVWKLAGYSAIILAGLIVLFRARRLRKRWRRRAALRTAQSHRIGRGAPPEPAPRWPARVARVAPEANRKPDRSEPGTLLSRPAARAILGAMTKRICVTGASGRAGRVTVADLLAHEYDVVATDQVRPSQDLGTPVLLADLTDHGQAVEVLAGTDAVVHLANIPAPGIHTPAVTFNANMTMNFNVFLAAAQVHLDRVVWASSETTLGLPFDEPPRYAPVDEDHYPVPTTTYALSKVASETVAGHIADWSGVPFIGLRFSNILGPTDYEQFPSYWPDPLLRKWNLWGYIDERDAAAASRLALEADAEGSTSYIIAAADTVMNRSSAGLLKEVFPGVTLRRDVGEFGSLLATDRAREALGFVPQHSWRDHVAPPKS